MFDAVVLGTVVTEESVTTDGYVAISGDNKVAKYNPINGSFQPDPSFGTAGKIGATGSGNGQFSGPYDVALSPNGSEIAVSDAGNNRIQKFDGSGAFLTAWAVRGESAHGPAYPAGVATDGSGHVYVGVPVTKSIQKFDASGGFLTAWGSGDRCDNPGAVATDGSENVYVADHEDNLTDECNGPLPPPPGVRRPHIEKFDASGTLLTAWGSEGSGDGQFIGPDAVATDGSGNVYVADVGNHRIQKFDAR